MKELLKILALFLLSSLVIHCDDETEKLFNYVMVTVNLTAVVHEGEHDGNPLSDEEVRLLIVKDGGERIDEIGVTDADGTTSALATFKLYKEQPIEACISLVALPDVYRCETITWQVVDAGATESGGERNYNWDLTLSLVYPL
jgi:hypothetical protein